VDFSLHTLKPIPWVYNYTMAKKEGAKTDRHHRRPRSIGGTNKITNISIVPEKQHKSWHRLFANHEAEIIAEIINHKWIDPQYGFVTVRREYLDRAKRLAKKLNDK